MKGKKVSVLMMLAVMVISILSSCATADGKVALPGTSWTLLRIGEDSATGDVSLKFEDDRVSGNASCNNYFGSYTLEGDSLSLGPLGSTLMACENMEQETAYLKALSEVRAVQIADGQLILTDEYGNARLVFVPMQHASLEGTIWVLTGWNTGSAISSVVLDTEITLELTEGQASGSAGCNHYFSSYTLADAKITFGVVGSTEMYCMEPDGVMAQEVGVLKALGLAASYEIERDNLVLYNADGTRLLTFTVQK